MNCIIVDDEPLAREAVEMLINETGQLTLAGSFNNAASAAKFIHEHPVDLIFLDIRMPKVSGLEFARTIPKSTLVIFTTAYAEYAIDSYEVDAVDYLVKPIIPERFQKAVEKAMAYHALLLTGEKENIENVENTANNDLMIRGTLLDRTIRKEDTDNKYKIVDEVELY